MPRLDVSIPAADGDSKGTLHVPDGDGPWPGVLLFAAHMQGANGLRQHRAKIMKRFGDYNDVGPCGGDHPLAAPSGPRLAKKAGIPKQ